MVKRMFLSLFVFAALAGAIYFVAAQTTGQVIVNAYFYIARLNANSACTALLANPCTDTDGGFVPTQRGQVAADVASLIPNQVWPNGTTYWYPAPSYQCFLGNEFCNPAGNLMEAVCGHNAGISTENSFNFAFPNNIIPVYAGEPAALLEVNCAAYAANNPQLGLQGFCRNGACV